MAVPSFEVVLRLGTARCTQDCDALQGCPPQPVPMGHNGSFLLEEVIYTLRDAERGRYSDQQPELNV